MLTLLHISDLHFGLPRARRLAEAVLAAEAQVRPAAVVCSGDLVEWAETNGPWREARRFFERLTRPWLVTPGNHDLARINLLGRLVAPFARYRRFIQAELDTALEVDGAVLVGVGSAKRACLDLGRLTDAQLVHAEHHLGRARAGALKVVAMHHGPAQLGRGLRRDHLWGARRVRAALARMGTHLLLTGHGHFPHVARLEHEGGAFIWAQAGSAGSSRLESERARRNSLSVIRAGGGRLSVEWWHFHDGRGAFEPYESRTYALELTSSLAAAG